MPQSACCARGRAGRADRSPVRGEGPVRHRRGRPRTAPGCSSTTCPTATPRRWPRPAAGGILVGKTQTHEFAWGLTSVNEAMGTARNPWSPELIAGGSAAVRRLPWRRGSFRWRWEATPAAHPSPRGILRSPRLQADLRAGRSRRSMAAGSIARSPGPDEPDTRRPPASVRGPGRLATAGDLAGAPPRRNAHRGLPGPPPDSPERRHGAVVPARDRDADPARGDARRTAAAQCRCHRRRVLGDSGHGGGRGAPRCRPLPRAPRRIWA